MTTGIDGLTQGMTDRAPAQAAPPALRTPPAPAHPAPAQQAGRRTAARPSLFGSPQRDLRKSTPLRDTDNDPLVDGLNRKLAATVAHLIHARHLLSMAEDYITAQQSRILMLEDLATMDDLTGLKNRRGIRDALTCEIERCNRKASKGGLLIMIDLDNFKTINDTHGHPAGDGVLKLVARTLEDTIRLTDTAGRLGGDEFVLLLSDTTPGAATARAQHIGWCLNNLSMAWYGDVIPVQASLGMKAFGAGAQIDAIMKDADATLYASKSTRHSHSVEGEPRKKTPVTS